MPECIGSGDQYSLDRFVNTLADLLIKYQAQLNLEDLEGGNAGGVSAPFLFLQNKNNRCMLYVSLDRCVYYTERKLWF